MAEDRGKAAGKGKGVTWRAVAVGLGLLVLLAPASFYLEMMWPGLYRLTDGIPMFASGIPAPAPVVLLLLLTAVAQIGFLRRFAFTRTELLVIYSMVLVASPLFGSEVLPGLVGKGLVLHYHAEYEPGWDFVESVPLWFAPTERAAVERFFLGRATVPWSLWWVPLAAWSCFMLCLFTANLCILSLLQRQWIAHERLTFPLAQIPLSVVRDSNSRSPRAAGRLPIGSAFWIGLAISFVLNFTDGLSHIAGPVGISLYKTYELPETTGPLGGIGPIYVFISIWAIAIAYLIPTELTFSVWVLWLVRLLLTMAAIAFGADAVATQNWESTDFPAPYYQSVGAAFALLAWWLWRAKAHLKYAWRVALGQEVSRHEASEPLPYRLALAGLVVSFAALICFCVLSGTQLLFGLILIAMIVGSHVVWARLGAETGMAFMCWPLQPTRTMVAFVGTGALRKPDVVTASIIGWASLGGQGSNFQVFASRVMETFKVADSGGVSSRRLTGAVVAAFIFALAVGMFVVLTGMYSYGYTNTAMDTASRSVSRHVGDWVLWIFDGHENGPDIKGIIAVLFGGLMAIALGVLHTRLWWWPLHPLGYLVAFTHVYSLWVPFFIGWICKATIVRYGGLHLYRRTIPLAIGLIVGDLVNKMLWAVVMLVTGGCF